MSFIVYMSGSCDTEAKGTGPGFESRLESDCGSVHSRIGFRNCNIGLGGHEEVVDSIEHLRFDVICLLLPMEHGGLAFVLGSSILLVQLCSILFMGACSFLRLLQDGIEGFSLAVEEAIRKTGGTWGGRSGAWRWRG